MPIKIPDPKTKLWNQTNNSDVLGSLWTSFNLDLNTNQGKMRVGKRLVLNTNTSDTANLGLPVSFRVLGSKIYALCDTRLFQNGSAYPSSGVFTAVASTPTNFDKNYSDMEVFNRSLYITQGASTTVSTYDGSSWSSFSAGSNTSQVRLLTAYGARLYMTDGTNKIISWDTSNLVQTTGQWTLDFSAGGDSQIITWMRSSANRIWIGTVNTLGGKGYIYSWDGSSSQATSSYRLEASGALACVIKDDVPYVIDSNGSLLKWNGGNFQKLTEFYRQNNVLFNSILSRDTNRFIHPNGMTIVNGKVNILINGSNGNNGNTLEETIPSGVWEFDETIQSLGIVGRGLTHKGSAGLSHSGDSITDYGQNRISRAGALTELNMQNTASTRNGTFLCGATYFTDATTTTNGIFYDDSNDTLQKAGYFITTKIYSSDITNTWQSLYAKFRRLGSATDKIIVKYRTQENDPTEMTITWSTVGASTTTLTTTDTNIANYAIGDEIEVTQGSGGGRCAHIVSISAPSGGTYTVVIDEVFTGVTGTAKARFNQWIKMGSVINQTDNYLNYQFKMAITSTWIQIKFFMILTGKKDLDELQIQAIPSQNAK